MGVGMDITYWFALKAEDTPVCVKAVEIVVLGEERPVRAWFRVGTVGAVQEVPFM